MPRRRSTALHSACPPASWTVASATQHLRATASARQDWVAERNAGVAVCEVERMEVDAAPGPWPAVRAEGVSAAGRPSRMFLSHSSELRRAGAVLGPATRRRTDHGVGEQPGRCRSQVVPGVARSPGGTGSGTGGRRSHDRLGAVGRARRCINYPRCDPRRSDSRCGLVRWAARPERPCGGVPGPGSGAEVRRSVRRGRSGWPWSNSRTRTTTW